MSVLLTTPIVKADVHFEEQIDKKDQSRAILCRFKMLGADLDKTFGWMEGAIKAPGRQNWTDCERVAAQACL
jgi:hypothetical protein